MMELFVAILIFLLGLGCGSFINMLVYRTAVGYGLMSVKNQKSWRSIKDCFKSLFLTDRSFCDFCGKQLNWYENIPVVSWLMQGGKTRCCRKKLPLAYPMVELGTGILFLIMSYRFGVMNWWGLALGLIIITLLVFSAIFDVKYMVLPDFSTYILIAIAFTGVLFDEKNIITYILSSLGAGGFLLFLHILTKGRGMGMGDVKIAVFMGLLLGWPKVVIAFYIAFIAGALVGGAMMVVKKLKRNSLIPFGPFLIGGTVVVWWWGEVIIKFLNNNLNLFF